MNNGASLRDRATQASPRAPAGLGHPVSIPSAGRSRTFAACVASYEAMDAAYGAMLEHGLQGGPAYDFARDRFNALVARVRDEAARALP